MFEEIFNQGKFQVADEIYASDFVNHGLHKNFDLQADQAAVHAEKKAFPDLKITADLMVAEGDLVTVVWTFRGTNTAAGYGLPPTGARIELRGITVWRIVDGKIREEWTSFDDMQAARQLVSQLKWQLLGLLVAAVILVMDTLPIRPKTEANSASQGDSTSYLDTRRVASASSTLAAGAPSLSLRLLQGQGGGFDLELSTAA